MNKFKIGDKVRVINNNQGYSEDFTGQESKIIATEQGWCRIKVQYKDGSYKFLMFNENELEKVVEQPSTIPVGAIVKITIDSEIGDEKLYVNYGIVRNYTEEEHPYIFENYDVAVIFNRDQEFDEYPYYPRQLEVVYPEKVAPDLWGSVADKLTDSEKINLVQVIFDTTLLHYFEDHTDINSAFTWSETKQGHEYWRDVYKRITRENQECTEEILTTIDDSNDAASILQQAKDCLVNRAVERDKHNGERSMKSCVEAFNALTGKSLTEGDGWLLMVCLKAARAKGGRFRLDDYVDGSAYFALYGEAEAQQ